MADSAQNLRILVLELTEMTSWKSSCLSCEKARKIVAQDL